MRKPEQVIKSVMAKLAKHGKGIILMHDFQHATAEAVPELFKQLKAGGYKVVQVVGKTPVEPLPEYKAMRAQGDGRRAGCGAPDVERDPDHPRQLKSRSQVRPAAQRLRGRFFIARRARRYAGIRARCGPRLRARRAA